MVAEEFPLILSPNLGSPKIISVKELIRDKVPINIILAGQYGEFICPTKDMFKDAFKLVSSYPEDLEKEISLDVIDIKEITGWNRLFDFSSPEETQLLINSELHYNVLGEGTKYWLIKAVPKTDGLKELEYEYFLKKGEGEKWIPTLYDLIFTDKSLHKKINYHAVQFAEAFEKDLNFIHLTDLHIAQRNDDILGEVLKKWGKGTRSREAIKKNYINFNDNLRRFIYIANELADKGKLDFIVITGDIVDFSGNGWDDHISPAENSWKVFIDIMTGRDAEGSRGFRLQKDDLKDEFNHGIKIAIFTSTGNHDWRLHPYSLISYIPGQSGKYGEFGLIEEEAKNFNYNSFDSSKYPTDKRKILSDALTQESLKRLNLDALNDKWSIKIAKGIGLLKVNLKESSVVAGLIGAGVDLTTPIDNKYLPVLLLAGAAVPAMINQAAELTAKKLADILVDNPLHADVVSLHYYFMHINPYFDYAFSFGDSHFVLMDTGADVVTIRADELMDGVKVKHLKKISIQDNFLGSSPDSIAFDDRQAYYNWEQIVWLDKVLSTISNKKRTTGRGRTFICLHAPPLNYDIKDPECNLDDLLESKTNNYISEDCNLTYGTINHYLSQFFFLCSGKHENPHRRIHPEADDDLEKVDLVLSGHAHIDVEFRVDIEYDENIKENKIRIYHDAYSKEISNFDKKRPVMLQTASCGPPSEKDKKAPSWRMVRVNKESLITCFEHENLDAWLKNKENKPAKHPVQSPG